MYTNPTNRDLGKPKRVSGADFKQECETLDEAKRNELAGEDH